MYIFHSLFDVFFSLGVVFVNGFFISILYCLMKCDIYITILFKPFFLLQIFPIYTWLCILECLFWEDRSRSSFGFQLAIKPTFVSTVKVCTTESTLMAYVDHLFHALGISSYCIRSINGTSLVSFNNTSCYKSISWKVMNSPNEYSSTFKGLFTNFSWNIKCNNFSP